MPALSTIPEGDLNARAKINDLITLVNADLKNEAAIQAIIYALRATLESAQEGTSNGEIMTPVRSKQQFNFLYAAALAALTKSSVGLGNVDNTSDANKPISLVAQAYFDAIADEFADIAEASKQITSHAFASPGLTSSFFTSTLTGKAANTTPIAIGAVATSAAYGTVWEVEGADFPGAYFDIARRQDFLVIPGRIYRVRMAMERETDPIDPFNNAVEIRMQNLSSTHAHVSNVRIGDPHVVTIDPFLEEGEMVGGPLDVSFTVSRDPPAGITVDYSPPATTRYMRPYLRIHGGTPQVDRPALLEVEDVTVAEEVRQRVALLETTGIENLALSQSEAEVGATVAPTVTWDIVGTAPVSALTIQINGGSQIPLATDAVSYSAPNATADTTYTVRITNGTTGEVKAVSTTLDFKNRVYWGASASTSLDSAGVVGLASSALANARQRSINAAASAEYVFYAYPAAMGAPSDYRMFGFSTVPVATTVEVTTGTGATLDYIVLRTPELLTDAAVAIEVL